MEITTIDAYTDIAQEVLQLLKDRQADGAAVLALHGDLGAGKTTFMQQLAATLGVTESVTSPTFVVMKIYDLKEQAYDRLVHIDAYRIEELEEMQPLRLADYLADTGNLVAIEWAEHIADLLPSETVHMYIDISGETRNVRFT